MKVTELYYEKLVTTGNYSNVRFGMRALVEEGDSEYSVRSRMKQEVDEELSRMIAEKAPLNVEANLRYVIQGLKAQEKDAREQLKRLKDWREANAELVKPYELSCGKEFEAVPF